MWPKTFEARLSSWMRLREQCADLELEPALIAINQWWFQPPWTAYHLHWDDQLTWPDPWQLLGDNIYCDLARGLGIMYTITLLDRPDVQTAQLVEVGADNLVVISDEKYILNWDRDQIVNINLTLSKVRHSVSQQQLKQQIQ
jgi:hypothetical protein